LIIRDKKGYFFSNLAEVSKKKNIYIKVENKDKKITASLLTSFY